MSNPKAERLAALETQATQIAEQIHALRSELLAAAMPGDLIDGGTARWKVSPGKRTFNEKIARATLPAELIAAAEVAKVDGAAVKRVSQSLWEACCVQGEPFLVTVR